MYISQNHATYKNNIPLLNKMGNLSVESFALLFTPINNGLPLLKKYNYYEILYS